MLDKHTVNLEHGGWENLVFHSTLFNAQPKTHDFTGSIYGVDYVFEKFSEKDDDGYMTAQKKGVVLGDYVLLKLGSVVEKYRIESLDRYSSPSDMWVALLIKEGVSKHKQETMEGQSANLQYS